MKDLDIEIKEKEVVVFQMGKVASTAIVDSISSCGIKTTQPHFLTMDSFLILLKKFGDPDFHPWTAKHTLGQIEQNIVIHNRIQKQKKYRYRESDGSSTLKILSVAREPLGWYLSDIAQNYPEYSNDIETICALSHSEVSIASNLEDKVRYFLREVIKTFNHNIDAIDRTTVNKLFSKINDESASESMAGTNILIKHCINILRPVFWFQEHFDPIVGTDFEEMPFDIDAGHSVVHHDCYDILILRFEDLEESGERKIGEFLNISDFKLKKKNVTADKEIGLAVKKSITSDFFQDDFLNKVFSNMYCEKFYGERRINELKEKYKKPLMPFQAPESSILNYFTSITVNYLPKARVLADSVKRHNPEAVFHLILSDKIPEEFSLDDEPFDTLFTIDQLDIPDLDSWIFKHRLVELCTAVKGAAFIKIFDSTDARKLVYLDPDIVVLDHMEELSALLDEHSVVLTPHQVEPDLSHQAIMDNEVCSLKHGIYNLGFLAVRKSEEGLNFLQWWRDRLLSYCYDDIPNGLFTDQRWVDLAPAFFNDIYILRKKTYNVATWNLSHRSVFSENNKLKIEGETIKFFHFSGFDSGAQEIMMNRYAPNNEVLAEFRRWYIEELKEQGQEVYGDRACIYASFSNGAPISDTHRLLYRRRRDLIKAFPKPAEVTDSWKCYYKWFQAHTGKKGESHGETAEVYDSSSEQQLVSVLNSWSWRITKPLRWFKNMLRKIKHALV